MSTNARGASAKLNLTIHAADPYYGGLRPGLTTDQSSIIQNAIDDAKEGGYVLQLPPWTFRAKNLRCEGGLNPWGMRGAGTRLTVVEHFDGAANFFANPTGSSVPYFLEDMTISGRYSATLSGSANNLIVVTNTSGFRGRRLRLVDFKEAAVLAQDTGGSPGGVYGDNVLEDCEIDGGGVANVGANFAHQIRSGFVRCRALGGNKSGTPGFGLQFKDSGDSNFMLDCYARGWATGFANGGTGIAVAATIRGCKAYDCSAIATGTFERSVIDVDGDMLGVGQAAVGLTGASKGNRIFVAVKGLAAARAAVRFESGCVGNVATVTNMDAYTAGARAAIFDSGAQRNTVTLESVTNEPAAYTVASLSTFTTPSDANAFTIVGYETHEDVTIAGGVATIRNAATTSIRVDTEGAAASDDLDTITHPNPSAGMGLYCAIVANARDVNMTNSGNLVVNGGASNRVVDNARDQGLLRWSPALAKWLEVSFSNNGA